MRILALVGLVACGPAPSKCETTCEDSGTTDTITPAYERVVYDDVGGSACLLGAAATTPEIPATTSLVEGATASVLVTTSFCAPQPGCNTDIDVGCSALLDGTTIVVDAWSAYTPLPSVSCPSSCAQMWMTCDLMGVLPAGPVTLTYEAYPSVSVDVPMDGVPTCVVAD